MSVHAHSEEIRRTFTMSNSRIIFTAARTSYSRPCISKHMLLNTTSAPVVSEICFRSVVTCEELRVVGGRRTLNWMGRSQNEAT